MNPKEKAIHSAQFILEEIREQGKEGIAKLSQVLGYPEGVIAAALDDIFARTGKWIFELAKIG